MEYQVAQSNHKRGRKNEREIIEHLRGLGASAVDLATEKGIGQLTPEDLLVWHPDVDPDPYWHLGGDENAMEVQAKWSKRCRGFKKLLNKHDKKGVDLGDTRNAHHDWSYGDGRAIYWESYGCLSGGINAWLDYVRGEKVGGVCVGYRVPKFIQDCLRADAVICRGPRQPFLVVWHPDVDGTNFAESG